MRNLNLHQIMKNLWYSYVFCFPELHIITIRTFNHMDSPDSGSDPMGSSLLLVEIVLQFFLKLDPQHIFLLESIGYLHPSKIWSKSTNSSFSVSLFQLEEELYKLVVYLLFPLAFSQVLKIVHHHDKNYA